MQLEKKRNNKKVMLLTYEIPQYVSSVVNYDKWSNVVQLEK